MRDSIKSAISDAKLVSGSASTSMITVTEPQKRKVAVFSNGVALAVENFRWTGEFKTLERHAKLRNVAIEQVLDATTVELEEIYASEKDEAPETQVLDLERQQEMKDLIERAAREGASDIVIRIVRNRTEIRTRVYSRMKDLDDKDEASGSALIMATFAVASDTGSASSMLSFMQGALTPKSGLLPHKVEMIRLQYSATSEGRGALVMRLKYKSPANEMEIDHLGYNARQISDITTMRTRTNGLYILAGKVSSGKSTTLQRVLNKAYHEKRREISMYSIEEPVELDLPSAIQVPAKKTPDGVDGFEAAMKASLRSDPNIIVLGEIRSRELSALGIQAVMTGHALWTTIHAGSALGILDRLSDFGVESWKLVDPTIVRGLVYQRLAGVICKECRLSMLQAMERKLMTTTMVKKLSNFFRKHPSNLFIRGDGCPKCKMGFSGRTVVAETVLTDPKLLALYAEGKRIEMRDYWLKSPKQGGMGGVPVLHHALSKVGAGICDFFDVEEEVDLFSVYERDYMHLHGRMLHDVAILEGKPLKPAANKPALEKAS